MAKLSTISLIITVVPTYCRLAILCPMLKKDGPAGVFKNASWVSLLSETHAISPHQHDFLARRSCLSNLRVFEEAVTSVMDEGHTVEAIGFDFAKSLMFEFLLNSFGLGGAVVQCLEACFTGRQWRTLGDHSKAQWCSTRLRDMPTLVSSFRKWPPRCPQSTDTALCGRIFQLSKNPKPLLSKSSQKRNVVLSFFGNQCHLYAITFSPFQILGGCV